MRIRALGGSADKLVLSVLYKCSVWSGPYGDELIRVRETRLGDRSTVL